MAQPTPVPTERDTRWARTDERGDRLLKTGLIGAGALTVTWWALIACGIWQAIEWVGA